MASPDRALDLATTNRVPATPSGRRFLRHLSLLGSGLCSLLALMACSPKERVYPPGGGGAGGGSSVTGTGGAGTGSSTSSGSGGGTGGSGGSCTTADPACECVGGKVVARDADGDMEGSIACAEAPGKDCDDTDPTFVKNVCGGCTKLGAGKVGDACMGCGVLACQGDSALPCTTPMPAPTQCLNSTSPQVCSGAQWATLAACSGATPACFQGTCVECIPGTHKCGMTSDGMGGMSPVVITCLPSAKWEPSWSISCTTQQTCNAALGTCIGLFHLRDLDFEVPALLREAPSLPAERGRSTQDVLDLAVGLAFG